MEKLLKKLSIVLIISNLLVFLYILLKYFNSITIPTGIFGSEYFFSKMNRGIDYLNSIETNNSPGIWYIFYLYIFYFGYISLNIFILTTESLKEKVDIKNILILNIFLLLLILVIKYFIINNILYYYDFMNFIPSIVLSLELIYLLRRIN